MTREEAITWLENRAKQIPLPGALEVYRMAIAALRELDAKENQKPLTLEGVHHASVGDYIIKGVKGEFYPCKPDIFANTYEEDDHAE